jgi:hypothetical protein
MRCENSLPNSQAGPSSNPPQRTRRFQILLGDRLPRSCPASRPPAEPFDRAAASAPALLGSCGECGCRRGAGRPVQEAAPGNDIVRHLVPPWHALPAVWQMIRGPATGHKLESAATLTASARTAEIFFTGVVAAMHAGAGTTLRAPSTADSVDLVAPYLLPRQATDAVQQFTRRLGHITVYGCDAQSRECRPQASQQLGGDPEWWQPQRRSFASTTIATPHV